MTGEDLSSNEERLRALLSDPEAYFTQASERAREDALNDAHALLSDHGDEESRSLERLRAWALAATALAVVGLLGILVSIYARQMSSGWPWQLILAPVAGAALLGVVPGIVLRIVVLLYPDDRRRRELVAELYSVPKWERPFWVTEQIEVAVFEGLSDRLHDRRLGRGKKGSTGRRFSGGAIGIATTAFLIGVALVLLALGWGSSHDVAAIAPLFAALSISFIQWRRWRGEHHVERDTTDDR